MPSNNESSNVLQFRPMHTKTRSIEETAQVSDFIYEAPTVHALAVFQWLMHPDNAAIKTEAGNIVGLLRNQLVNRDPADLSIEIDETTANFFSELNFITVLHKVTTAAEQDIDSRCEA